MKTTVTALACLLSTAALAQQAPAAAPAAPPAPPRYRATDTKINALVHTKLAVGFDYAKRHLNGKAWLTLKPYAYATDSLRLDAKGFDIKTVALVNGEQLQPLKYTYADQNNLRIQLGKAIAPGTPYTVYIEYTAKPDELKVKGSAAINDAKGLYFINPDSAVKGKPVQIWTQGETEGSSCWFPTIDRPNQKTTSEISMTVPAKYVTLSNGRMVSSTPAAAGLRTDTWKMELPHSPYLFMLAVGDFKVAKDTWRGKEVSYYLEPKYAPFAKQIFGNTPDMLEFFSTRLGVEYPWNKYAQIVVRDYVSGAMENTTATLHGDFVQMTDKQLLDRDYQNESVIAHELFHQWFGDYVTAESWSNLTVNESLADFSEGLYAEHKYGADAADSHRHRNLRLYLRSAPDAAKQLVRFTYDDKEDMFDVVTYQKGGAILDMLRTYLGDDVFFAGLQKYLKDNALGNGEAHQMRLAMEAVSGQDLNWFYNQWYFGTAHPVVTIDYGWDAAKKVQSVTVKQTQPGQVFRLPFAIDYYVNGKAQRQRVVMTQATQTFTMPLAAKPALVDVDAEKTLVWQHTNNMPLADFAYQYAHAPLYVARREALLAADALQLTDPAALKLLLSGLQDPFNNLRMVVAERLKLQDKNVAKVAAPILRKQAAQEKEPHALASLLTALAKLQDKKDEKLFARQLATSPSYAVQAAALQALAEVNPTLALRQAQALEGSDQVNISQAVVGVYAKAGGLSQWAYVRDKFDAAGGQDKVGYFESMGAMLPRLQDAKAFAEDVDRLKGLAIQYKRFGADQPIIGMLQAAAQQQAATPNQALAEKAVAEIQAAQ
ncbi:M1 family metallopeptidase [Hymenobacter chitinivorans]|uniref:Aminopeptidase N n=1 Tax=Hymenobacter chitinivorans DSM 11115 TaxID=1121954 RepID=A0A2M9BPD8_9BACT|nr:M1 family metallopeptidase [Hymenobacter chitinivorans]PJJ59807.1 aminopeptidase N [Hymenobacter chitinivorans DSM 11115]